MTMVIIIYLNVSFIFFPYYFPSLILYFAQGNTRPFGFPKTQREEGIYVGESGSKLRDELKGKGLLWNSTNMGGGYIMQCHLKGFMRQHIMGKR